jgi:hypothetical protein
MGVSSMKRGYYFKPDTSGYMRGKKKGASPSSGKGGVVHV